MPAADTESTGTQSKIVSPNQHRGATYRKVVVKRKRPIRGSWERNGRDYVQLTGEDERIFDQRPRCGESLCRADKTG
jgi:hypothetical protein